MFAKIGLLVYKTRWAIVVFWLALTILGAIFAPKAVTVLKNGGFNAPNAEAVKVNNELASRFGGSRSYIFALFTAPDNRRADDPAFIKQVDEAVAPLRQYSNTTQVLTYASTGAKDFISSNGRYSYALLGFKLDDNQAQDKLKEISGYINKGNLDLKLTGLPVGYQDFSKISQQDAEQAEILIFPVALLILLLVFRTVVAAAMPLMMAAVSVIITLMLAYFIGQLVDLSTFVLNIATLLGLGIGLDYSLLIINRFREELYNHSGNVKEAIVITTATAGKATFFSGLTVLIGIASLLLSQFIGLRGIGIGGLLVVCVNVLAALTLLPAVLGLLGPRINQLKIPGLKAVEQRMAQKQQTAGFWHHLPNWVAQHRIGVIVIVLVVLFAIGSPFLHIRFGEPDYTALPPEVQSRQADAIFQENFPDYRKNSDVYLIVKANNGQMTDAANSSALYDYATSLKAKFPQVKQITAGGQDFLITPKAQLQQLWTRYADQPQGQPSTLDQPTLALLSQTVNGDSASLKLLTNLEYSTQSAENFIRDLRAFQPANLKVLLGGPQPSLMEFVNGLYKDFPITILIVAVLTYLILFVMFESVLLPLKAIIMTGLSLTASYGALVWFFQDGNLAAVLGFTPLGYVEATVPILLFSILFGLSMDYEVFMLSRIKEYYKQSGNNNISVAQGLESTAGLITSAALAMVVVAGAFATANITVVKGLGIGIALAIALDATVIRTLLLPTTMTLLGKANWWVPGFLHKILPSRAAPFTPQSNEISEGDLVKK